jgi:hypothetical protein
MRDDAEVASAVGALFWARRRCVYLYLSTTHLLTFFLGHRLRFLRATSPSRMLLPPLARRSQLPRRAEGRAPPLLCRLQPDPVHDPLHAQHRRARATRRAPSGRPSRTHPTSHRPGARRTTTGSRPSRPGRNTLSLPSADGGAAATHLPVPLLVFFSLGALGALGASYRADFATLALHGRPICAVYFAPRA